MLLINNNLDSQWLPPKSVLVRRVAPSAEPDRFQGPFRSAAFQAPSASASKRNPFLHRRPLPQRLPAVSQTVQSLLS